MKSLDQFAVNPALLFVRSNKGGGKKRAEKVAHMEDRKNAYAILVEKHKERDHLKDLGLDVVILK